MVDVEGVAVEAVAVPLGDAEVEEGEVALCVDEDWLLGEGMSGAVGTKVGYLRRGSATTKVIWILKTTSLS
jgi:hypothetical protein